MVKTGCDILADGSCDSLRGRRIALLANPASVSSRLVHVARILLENGIGLNAIFGPQHGFRGDTQANMIEWEGYIHPIYGIPVHSLYGKTRKPAPGDLSGIDMVVIDLPDIGARQYTYIWTALMMIEECSRLGVEVLILDRPDPIGGSVVEGPVLREEYFSFVGMHQLPARHGLTIGEALLMISHLRGLSGQIKVIALEEWKRDLYFDGTGLPWVLPSPNMPTLETAIVYPGMVLLEGTNISEGRGTTRPFEIIGAPWIDSARLLSALERSHHEGVAFRPLEFSPAWDKYAGRLCQGIQLHVTSRELFRPFRTAAILIRTISDLFGDDFEWLLPPYEYDDSHMPVDIISGGPDLRLAIDMKSDMNDLFDSWKNDENDFLAARREFLLYE
ncbi:MAG: DUF1343 domain-containing protein [Candidatus Krumholzibacteriota bacterium]|nr:DUF1343 domain-containing protein [Candidatus Krumholzibacteriota bacterium]